VNILKTKAWKITSKIIYWLAISILIILAVTSVFTILDLPLKYKMYNVQTGSMKPVIQPGDLIIVKKEDNYEIEDIITFYSGTGESQATVTHRITKEEDIDGEKYFVTKGDFNSVEDIDKVDPNNIVGKYIFKIPLIGHPIEFMRTPVGLILLIIIPTTIIINGEVNNIRKELENRRKQKEEF
jgi:signal peptidase